MDITIERPKNLVLHADDLGLSQSVNDATLSALSCGWVSSASVMAPCPSFASAALYAQKHPELDIGVHLTLTCEWSQYKWGPVSPISDVPSLVDTDGFLWSNLDDFERHAGLQEVELEIHAQIRRAIESGISVSHVDTHMFALFRNPRLLALMVKAARHYQLPCLVPRSMVRRWGRSLTLSENDIVMDRLFILIPEFVPKDSDNHHPLGDSSNWLGLYEKLLRQVGGGITQLIVHLGYDRADLRSITLDQLFCGAEWRARDLDVVSSVAFRKYLADQNIALVSWKDLSNVSLLDNRSFCRG